MTEFNKTPASINKKITLRFDPDYGTEPQIIAAKQLDSLTRILTVKLTKNGSSFKTPQNGEIKLRGTRADGTAFDLVPVESDDEKGVHSFAFTQSALSVSGMIQCDVVCCCLADETYLASTEVFYVDNIACAVDPNGTYTEEDFQSIETAVANANSAADTANESAAVANTSANNADIAASNANSAANKAESASTTASMAATAASTAAENAKNAAAEAVLAAENAESAASRALDAIDYVPDYWVPALETAVTAIREALQSAGRNKSAFFFYNDSHWDNEGSYSAKITPKLLKYLCDNTPIKRVHFGGDIVHAESADAETMEYLWEWQKAVSRLPNHHSVVGNHDDGNTTNNLFDENYIYAFLQSAEETPDIVRDDSGLWYYVDNPAEKTRYLFLDTAYAGFTSRQEEFVKNALSSTPQGWHIVATSHIWMDMDYSVTPPVVGDINSDASKLLGLFDSYNSREGIFESCGGWVEFCVGGHTHTDYTIGSARGIPVLLTETDSLHIRSGLSAEIGTVTEAVISAIIADYGAKTVKVIRIGRGDGRETALTWYEINYTNVLPLALASDGVSIYNEIGYKADTRWSSSGNTDADATGIYLSGYIPVSKGDVIRLKNITMPNEDGNYCMVHLFKTIDDTNEGNHVAAQLTGYNSAVWDESGNLSQFVIDGDYTFVRLQAAYMGTDSVVTINEEME